MANVDCGNLGSLDFGQEGLEVSAKKVFNLLKTPEFLPC